METGPGAITALEPGVRELVAGRTGPGPGGTETGAFGAESGLGGEHIIVGLSARKV